MSDNNGSDNNHSDESNQVKFNEMGGPTFAVLLAGLYFVCVIFVHLTKDMRNGPPIVKEIHPVCLFKYLP